MRVYDRATASINTNQTALEWNSLEYFAKTDFA